MAFLNASVLIFGSLLIAAPVVLHLLMRRKPKQLVFPALRFVKERRERNQRRMRLRQLLLLLLRCAAILVLAAALARPSADSSLVGDWLLAAVLAILFFIAASAAALAFAGGRGKLLSGGLAAVAVLLFAGTVYASVSALREGSGLAIGDEEAPVAAALVIDTSPRMTYRHENRTRLEHAQETALWLLPQLPPGSETAVLDSRPGAALFAVDRSAAQKAVERLAPAAVARALPDLVADAAALVQRSQKARKEIYVFTDLTAAAWREGNAARLKTMLEESPDVLVYVFDVGAPKPQNVSLGELKLSAERLTPGEELEVAVHVSRIGEAPLRAVELCLEAPNPTLPIVRDGKLITPEAIPRQRISFDSQADAPSTSSQIVRFAPLPKLPLGVHHGVVRLVGADALTLDDFRHFTIEVQPPWPVLIAAPASADVSFFTEAIAPYEFRATGQARFDCQTIPQSELASASLERFAAVFLLDPMPLAAAEWSRLADFAKQGGGLGIFLGRNAQNYASFNESAAQAVLPGKIAAPFIWNAPQGDLYLTAAGAEHPILTPFRALATVTPWREFPVYKHWVMSAAAPESSVIARFGNNKPAMLERTLGKGRAVVMTTPVSDPLNIRDREPWNQLPTGLDPWPFVILANETALYLVGAGAGRWNYTAGETAELPNDSQDHPERYELFPPGADPQEIAADDDIVTVRFLESPGAYRLKGSRGGPVLRGFSVNLSPGATDLTRGDASQLDAALGKENYELARTQDEFRRKIGLARQGREFYPFLMAVLSLIMGLEFALANRFYGAKE
jgi:hypothetical protein